MSANQKRGSHLPRVPGHSPGGAAAGQESEVGPVPSLLPEAPLQRGADQEECGHGEDAGRPSAGVDGRASGRSLGEYRGAGQFADAGSDAGYGNESRGRGRQDAPSRQAVRAGAGAAGLHRREVNLGVGREGADSGSVQSHRHSPDSGGQAHRDCGAVQSGDGEVSRQGGRACCWKWGSGLRRHSVFCKRFPRKGSY